MPNTVVAKNPSRLDEVKTTAPFYSALRREIEKQELRSAPVDGWMQVLNGLVKRALIKRDEVEWSGLTDWLDLQTGRVLKDDVVAYLSTNGVQIHESVLSDKAARSLPPGWQVLRSDDGTFAVTDNEGEVHGEGETEEEAIENAQDDDAYSDDQSAPRYEKYTLPGGKNYREVLLTLPTKDAAKLARANELNRMAGVAGTPGTERVRLLQERDRLRAEAGTGQLFKSRHWDSPNVLAHLRLNDRTDASGNKVLFVEEVQSDWGQEGKKKGFSDPSRPYEVFDTSNGKTVSRFAEELDASSDVIARGDGPFNYRDASGKTPAAPFITSTDKWLTLAIKRILKMAVDDGYDKVAFITGEQSAQRYDLSKQVDQLLYSKNNNGTYRLSAITGSNGKMLGEAIPAEKLEDYIGKEIAQRIINGEGKQTEVQGKYDPVTMMSRTEYMQSLSGLDLQVGGDGMRAFYDKIVPAAVKDVLKKVDGGQMNAVVFGGQNDSGRFVVFDDDSGERLFRTDRRSEATEYIVAYPGDASIKEVDGSASVGLVGQQPGFDITDSMRAKVANGFPLFSIADDGHVRAGANALYRTAPQAHHVAASVLRESLFSKHRPDGKKSFTWEAVAPPDGDDGRLARSVADTAKSLFGLDVVWIDFQGDPLFNGAISDLAPGKIFLNIRSSKPFMAVLGHEVLHHLQEAQPKIYADLLHGLGKLMRFDGVYASRLQAKYEKHGLTLPESGIHAELAGDIIGDSFTDARFWAELERQQSKPNKNITNSVKAWLKKVGVRIGELRPFGTDEFLVDVAAAHTAIANAMRQFHAATSGIQNGRHADNKRFNAGADLTPLQRRSVLNTLVDTYKDKGADREMKGLDGNGNERYGYVYSPELFERSDVTGAMLRYYVVLPDGRRAHPTEVFPHLTQDDVDRMAAEQEAREQKSVEYENAIKPFFNDYDAANLCASRDAVVISKSDKFAVIPDRWGAVTQARSNGWEVTTRPLHCPAEDRPHQRSPVLHYAVQECMKEVEPGVVKTIGYQVIHNRPGGTAAAVSRPLFACKRAGLETLMSAVADANHRVAHTMIDGSEAKDLFTGMPVIKSLQDAGLALPLAAVAVSDIQVKTLPIPDVQPISKEADAHLEVEVTDAPGTM